MSLEAIASGSWISSFVPQCVCVCVRVCLYVCRPKYTLLCAAAGLPSWGSVELSLAQAAFHPHAVHSLQP